MTIGIFEKLNACAGAVKVMTHYRIKKKYGYRFA